MLILAAPYKRQTFEAGIAGTFDVAQYECK